MKRIRDAFREVMYGIKLYRFGYWDLSDGSGKCSDKNWKIKNKAVLKRNFKTAIDILLGKGEYL